MAQLIINFITDKVKVNYDLTRGDSFNKLLFVYRNSSDDPGNLTGCQFHLQVRVSPYAEGDPLIDMTNDMFFTGQSAEAIAYDVAEGNPPGTTRDECHVACGPLLTNVLAGPWHYDLQVINLNQDVFTPVYGRFKIFQDVTRS